MLLFIIFANVDGIVEVTPICGYFFIVMLVCPVVFTDEVAGVVVVFGVVVFAGGGA
jgi:hypothetical protein